MTPYRCRRRPAPTPDRRDGAAPRCSSSPSTASRSRSRVMFLAPIVFLLLTSFMTSDQTLTARPVAANVAPGELRRGLHARRRWPRYLLNTVMYAGLATAFMLLSSVPAAYALAKLRWRGRNAMFVVIICMMMLPPQVATVPLYLMWANAGLTGSLWPLILPMLAGDAFSIFLLRQFLVTIPDEYLDAARVDGCGEWRTLLRVVLPMARPGHRRRRACSSSSTPGTTTTARCSTPARTRTNWTLSLGLASFKSLHHVEWNLVIAATVLTMVPIIVLFLLRPEGLRAGRDADGSQGMNEGRGRRRRVDLHARAGRRVRPPARPLAVDELVLIDPAADRLDVVGRFCAGLFAITATRPGAAGRPTSTPGSTAPTWCSSSCASAGRRPGSATRRSRSSAAASGRRPPAPGGLAKALRTVPVVLDVAERAARRAAPDAWIVDFTNPVGIVTRALLDAGHRAVGLCNVAIGFQRRFAGAARRRSPPTVTLDHVGLNHLTWERAAYVDGVDRLPELLASAAASIAAEVELPPERAARRWAACRRTTCATSTATTRSWREQRGAPTRGEAGGRDRGASCCACTPTRRWTPSRSCSASAAARSTPRRRVGLIAVAARRRARPARGQRAQRRDAAVPARRMRSSR